MSSIPSQANHANHAKADNVFEFENLVKIVTSSAFLLPVFSITSYFWLNTFAWTSITLGCVFHHLNPSSDFLHNVDHWCILVGIGCVMFVKLQAWTPSVCVYIFSGALLFRSVFGRMVVVTVGFACLVVWFADVRTRQGVATYVFTLLSVVCFVLQRMRVLHSHSVWHVCASVMGFLLLQQS